MSDTRWNVQRWDDIPRDVVADTVISFVGEDTPRSIVDAFTRLINAMYAYGIDICNCEAYAKAAFYSVDRTRRLELDKLHVRNEQLVAALIMASDFDVMSPEEFAAIYAIEGKIYSYHELARYFRTVIKSEQHSKMVKK